MAKEVNENAILISVETKSLLYNQACGQAHYLSPSPKAP